MASRTISAMVDGNRNVPMLWNNGDDWKLNLNWWDNDWNSSNRFLAVRHTHGFSRVDSREFLFSKR